MTEGSRRVPGGLLLIAAVLAVVGGLFFVLRPGSDDPNLLADDDFDGTVDEGWGDAPLGGRWSLSGTKADYVVLPGAARVTVPEVGLTRRAVLQGVTERDVEVFFRVKVDTPASGRGSFVYAILRHLEGEHEFRAKLRFAKDGAVYAGVTQRIGDDERDLSREKRVPDVTYTPGLQLTVRVRVDGDPGAILVKVWRSTIDEPKLWLMRSNARRGASGPGSVGVQAYVSNTSAKVPVTFTFERFEARRVIAPGPSNSPVEGSSSPVGAGS